MTFRVFDIHILVMFDDKEHFLSHLQTSTLVVWLQYYHFQYVHLLHFSFFIYIYHNECEVCYSTEHIRTISSYDDNSNPFLYKWVDLHVLITMDYASHFVPTWHPSNNASIEGYVIIIKDKQYLCWDNNCWTCSMVSMPPLRMNSHWGKSSNNLIITILKNRNTERPNYNSILEWYDSQRWIILWASTFLHEWCIHHSRLGLLSW